MWIAALFVESNGPYFGLPCVDPWDIRRNAQEYRGWNRVVAHPPCERWGRYAEGGPNPNARRFAIGDDSGCFAFAVNAVRAFGGVLEHPEASHAWSVHGLAAPPKSGGWIRADAYGYTCCVEQGNYGHAARKATWLYAVPVNGQLPELVWGKAHNCIRLDEGFRSKEAAKRERERRRLTGETAPMRLSRIQRVHTPVLFRDLLLSIARSI